VIAVSPTTSTDLDEELLDAELGALEQQWVENEFAAIIAASYAGDPVSPDPPGRVPGPWHGKPSTDPPAAHRWSSPRRWAAECRGRQRSPPTTK
jgi:hypothetical protein